jgi:polysaccharide deacetylase 2 family uncharacterized protein YibQ/8-oxo-dGTP pyrophosphatase MutT (NUDIX family)
MTQKHTLAAINELPPEVTLSFVPYANDLQGWINKARAAGHEVLLELPMEAYDYPNVDTGPHTLLTSAKPEENLRRLNILLGQGDRLFRRHQLSGRPFATDAAAADPVMKALKDRGLVFLHDGAAARSVLPQAANQTGLDFTVADRIVDAELTADAIDRELLALEALAIQNGKAIGVGFAYPVTIEQFRLWAEGLKAKGYQLAPASASAGVQALRQVVTYHAQPEQGGRDPSLYRPNVGLAIFSKKGHLWLGRRAGVRKDDVRYAWQMPQGGIDRGETPAIAALRELGEETGLNTKHRRTARRARALAVLRLPACPEAEAHRPLFRPAPEMVRLPLHRLRHGFPPRRPHTGIRRLEMGEPRRSARPRHPVQGCRLRGSREALREVDRARLVSD